MQEKSEIKRKTQSLAGENADRFPPPRDKEVSPGWESAGETAMYILPCFFPSTILLSSYLVKHPTLFVSSYHSLQLCWLKYVNQVQMKHIHWAFNFCAHLCQYLAMH